MKRIRIIITAVLLIVFCSHTALFAQPEKAWNTIFDGKTFKGWTIVDSPANVVIKDSAFLIHMTKNTSRHVFVRTKKKYKDFILELEVKRDTSFDSGILFRTIKSPDTAAVSLYGYQIKIDPSLTRRWTGGIFLDFGSYVTWLHPLEGDVRAQQAERVGEWNRFRIEAIGDRIKVWVNGIPTTNMINSRYKEGFIALKIHYLKNTEWNDQMQAMFKNIRIISKNASKYSLGIDIPVKETE